MEIDVIGAVGVVGDKMDIEVITERLEEIENEGGTGVQDKMEVAVTVDRFEGNDARNEELSLAPDSTSTRQRLHLTSAPAPPIETRTIPPIDDDPPRPFSKLDQIDDNNVDEYLSLFRDEQDGGVILLISDDKGQDFIIFSDDDEEHELGAQDYWTSARDNNVSSYQIRNHVWSPSVNEKLLDIGAIPAANPNKFEVNVEDDEGESQDGQLEIDDDVELTMQSDETEEEFQKRVTAFKMYIPIPIKS